MSELAEELRRWTDAVEPVTADEAIGRARKRSRRPRGAWLAGAAAVVALSVGAWVAVSTRSSPDVTAGSDSQEDSSGAGSGVPGLEASVQSTGLDPLRVSLGPIEGATNAWARHPIRYENTGNSDLYVDDTRLALLVGGEPARLLVGDEGCGYVEFPDATTIVPECNADYRGFVVPAGGSIEFDMTIWRDLPGMRSPQPGTYVFTKRVRFADHRFQPGVAEDDLQTGTIDVTYTIAAD